MSALNSQVVSDGRGWLKLVGLGFTVTGCVITPAMQYPGTQVVSRRLAAFPSEAVAWNYDFYGTRTVDNERRLIVMQNIDDSITYRVRRYGGRSFKAASVEGLDHAQAFRGWAVDTLTEISRAGFDTEGYPLAIVCASEICWQGSLRLDSNWNAQVLRAKIFQFD